MRLSFALPESLRGQTLIAELAAVGIDATVLANDADLDVIGTDLVESDRAAIQTVIDAHDGKPTEAEQRPGKVRDKLAAVVTTLEDAATDKAVWDALTQAQRSELNRRAALAVAKLIRHTLNQFDSPE